MVISHFLASLPAFVIISLINFCRSDQKCFKTCFSHLPPMIREEPETEMGNSREPEGKQGRGGERNCSGMFHLSVLTGKCIENWHSQRHWAGSPLLRSQAMRPLAVRLGGGPRVSTHHELATVALCRATAEANSRGQHLPALFQKQQCFWLSGGLSWIGLTQCSLCLERSFSSSSVQPAPL